MSENNKSSVEMLIDYIDNNSYISEEKTIQALKQINKKETITDPKQRELLLKVIGLINKRTHEITDFIDIIRGRMSHAEKLRQAAEHLPFKDGNIEIEKIIIEKTYDIKEEFTTFEDLLIDLLYEDIDEPEELKEQIKEILDELDIHISLSPNKEKNNDINPIQRNNK